MACKLVRLLSMTRRPVGEPSKLIVFRNSGLVFFFYFFFYTPFLITAQPLSRIRSCYGCTCIISYNDYKCRTLVRKYPTYARALIFINYLYRHEMNILVLDKSRLEKKKHAYTLHTCVMYLLRTPTSNYLITSYAFLPVFKHQIPTLTVSFMATIKKILFQFLIGPRYRGRIY